MQAEPIPEGPKTPPHRRMVATDVPGVFRRGDRYVAVTRHKGKQVKTYHRTKAEAKAEKGRRDAGGTPTDRERFEVYAERWLSTYQGRKASGITPQAMDDYRYLIREFAIPFFRGRRMGEIGPLDVKHYIEHLKVIPPKRSQKKATRLAPSSVRRILCPLKAMLAEAYELGITPNDASKVRVVVRDERPKGPPKAMNSEQVRAVLAALDDRDRLLFGCLAATGLRVGEALGLQWRDLRATDEGDVLDVRRIFYRGHLLDRTKTDESTRSVALVPGLAKALRRERMRSAFKLDEDPIFPALNGTHQDDHNVRRRLRPAAKAAGVEWVTPHVFRHTLATTMRDHGYDAETIAKVLGHTDAEFTRRTYIHQRAVPRFDDLDGFADAVGTDS